METLTDSLRVLVVDDNESFCVGLKDVLELYGHVVDYIIRGEDLSSALEGASFDAVIMDLKLPGYSGIDLAAFVKRKDPGIACIISTGHGKKPDVVDALNQGFEGFIEKPYKVEDLIIVLERGVRLTKTRYAQTLEKEVIESEERYRRLVETSPDLIIVHDFNGKVVFNNKAAADFLGYTQEEASEMTLFDTLPVSELSKLEERAKQRAEGFTGTLTYETMIKRGDGVLVPVNIRSTSIIGNGETPNILLIIRDITDRKRSEQRLSALHSMAFELSYTESVEAVVETSFRIMRESLGLQFSSFQLLEDEGLVTIGVDGGPILEMVFPLTGKGITTRVAREARTVLVGDVRVDPDYVQGTTDSLSELAVPILGEEGVLGVLNVESPELDAFTVDDARLLEVLARNVGSALSRLRAAEDKMELEREVLVQQVQVEQEQELGRLKTQFISTATHELRTPVTSILGFLEIVLDDPSREIPETVRKDLNVVQRNANRLVTLTNDLLDVQRITSGRFEINREPVDLVKTLNEVVEELSPLFDEKQQALFVDAPNELSLNVDEIRISQLFINLLRNANKFTPEEGKITVKVEPDEGNVLISVKDSGIGLSEEDIGKLFKPFPGINHGLNVSSTGLGLSIAKGIVELHGGDIWAESEGPGKGSTFFVKIPK